MKPHWECFELWVFLWAFVMAPLDSGGVCSMGSYFVFGIELGTSWGPNEGAHIRGP